MICLPDACTITRNRFGSARIVTHCSIPRYAAQRIRDRTVMGRCGTFTACLDATSTAQIRFPEPGNIEPEVSSSNNLLRTVARQDTVFRCALCRVGGWRATARTDINYLFYLLLSGQQDGYRTAAPKHHSPQSKQPALACTHVTQSVTSVSPVLLDHSCDL